MNVYVNEQFPYLDFMDIRPGDRVVLKPNLVKEGKETDKNEWKCVVTSPELIRYVANYVCEKLGGKGEVYICDAPQTDSSFEQIDKKIGLTKIASDCTSKYGVPVMKSGQVRKGLSRIKRNWPVTQMEQFFLI